MHQPLSPLRRTSPPRLRSIVVLVQILLFAHGARAETPPATRKVAAADESSSEPANVPPTPGEPSNVPPAPAGGARSVATEPPAKSGNGAELGSSEPATLPPNPSSSRPNAVPPPPKASSDDGWKFGYHGFLRAPLRFGVGERRPSDTPGYDVSGTHTTVHEASVPDDQTLSFQTTQHNPRSWAEAFFSFGNSLATGTIGFGSYNLTEGGFNDYEANWGITQAYVTLTPTLPWENVRLWAKAGAIVDKYGMSGRYDSGEYDMYMFGRTHVMGETAHLDYDLTPAWTLAFEQGFGSKKPDPNIYNNARYTMLHHEHLALKHGRDLEFGAHYLMSWSQEEYRPTGGAAQGTDDYAPRNGLPAGYLWVTGGEVRAELGAFGYLYGAYSHVGASYAITVSRAIEALSFSGGGEYSLGVVGNYLDSPNCWSAKNPAPVPVPPPGTTKPENWTPLDPDGCSDGNGKVDALHAHYEFSLTNFRQQISGGQRFWGDGQDMILKLYGMVAFVHSAARDTTKAPRDLGSSPADLWNASTPGYSVRMTKFGADLAVQALPWLTPAVRFDRVMPNSHLPEENFSILSPRVSFKSAWVTHERITVGYSRYFYDQRECEPKTIMGSAGTPVPNPDPLSQWRCTRPPPSPVPYDGFGTTSGKQRTDTRGTGVTRPDLNVFKVEATMWW